MRAKVLLAVLLALLAVSAPAEEILLADGTKIVGRMVAIKGDKIEVETPYGKMQIQRENIRSITFPDNQPAADTAKEKPALPVDESLDGTVYVNRTAQFSLTVPIEWKLVPELHQQDALAGLGSRDSQEYVMVVQEEFSGSLDAYAQLWEIGRRGSTEGFEKVSQTDVTIDGVPARIVIWGALHHKTLPIRFMTAIFRHGPRFVMVTGWAAEPLFKEYQGMLEKILMSYRSLGGPPAVTAGSSGTAK